VAPVHLRGCDSDGGTPGRIPLPAYNRPHVGERTRRAAGRTCGAEREALSALPGIDASMADRIAAERRLHGPYASLAALFARVPMPAATGTALKALNQAAQKAGTYSRR
jgi:hypothetical protein